LACHSESLCGMRNTVGLLKTRKGTKNLYHMNA
jgi:hypothetical protein